ncbi:unnamed protein product [Larinioides sclopetarius]|uniref:Uncharacterized protein n=2 Tax=Larinioides sclopetarius TaxID=280406 RepID=A0AAV2AQP2_9ARAC
MKTNEKCFKDAFFEIKLATTKPARQKEIRYFLTHPPIVTQTHCRIRVNDPFCYWPILTKMHLLSISIICFIIALGNSYKCPNGNFCNGGECCRRYLSRMSYECCMHGFSCGFLGGCYVVPRKIQSDADYVIDRDVSIPPSEPKDIPSIESINRDILMLLSKSKDMPYIHTIDRDNFIPSSEEEDMPSIESIDRDSLVPLSKPKDLPSIENIDKDNLSLPSSSSEEEDVPSIEFVDRDILIPLSKPKDLPSIETIDRDHFFLPSEEEEEDVLSIESIDKDIFTPLPEAKDVPSIESSYDSSKEIPVVQMGGLKKVFGLLKKII